ncbi:MAG: acetate--CoA ligase family protein [Acidimicrobiia bacterium]|nr:acetate--CoA ligase family protein [Acidimicrobiia bacterium]
MASQPGDSRAIPRGSASGTSTVPAARTLRTSPPRPSRPRSVDRRTTVATAALRSFRRPAVRTGPSRPAAEDTTRRPLAGPPASRVAARHPPLTRHPHHAHSARRGPGPGGCPTIGTLPPVPTLSEADSKALLSGYGVPLLRELTVATPAEAVRAAGELGYPVVVKLCGAGLAHKTERGLVRLGLTGPAAVEAAATELLAAAGPDDGEVGLLVAPMARGARELIAGAHRDPQFGPCVMLGVGGVTAEAVADVVFRLVPLDAVDAAEMIDGLATQALLDPFRGEPAVDRDALAAVVLALAAAVEREPGLVSAEVNPLLVVDGRPIAVDALVEVTP